MEENNERGMYMKVRDLVEELKLVPETTEITIPSYDERFRDEFGIIVNKHEFDGLDEVRSVAILHSNNDRDEDCRDALCLATGLGTCSLASMFDASKLEFTTLTKELIKGDKYITAKELLDVLNDVDPDTVVVIAYTAGDGSKLIDSFSKVTTAGLVTDAVGVPAVVFSAALPGPDIETLIRKNGNFVKCEKVMF